MQQNLYSLIKFLTMMELYLTPTPTIKKSWRWSKKILPGKNPTMWGISLFISKFLTMQDLKIFWKIPHNVGFIQLKIQHCEEFSSRLNWIIICINVKDLKGVITSLKKIIISIFFISKFLTMQDSKCFSKNSSQCWI